MPNRVLQQVWLVLLLLFTNSLCAAVLDARDLTVLDQAVLAIQARHNISAAAYGIVAGETTVILKTHGFHSHENKIPFTEDSIVRIGSITKTFTALGLMLATDSHNVVLDEPVTKYLSPVPLNNPWASTDPVTIAHLLEHTAGLRDLSKKEFDFNEPVSLSEALQINPSSRHIAWQPGKHSSYSNTGAGIVGLVLESVVNMSFEDYMNIAVFEPLGLGSASFYPPDNAHLALVRGYDTDGATPIPYWHQLYRPFGALNISPKDMIKVVRFFVRGSQAGSESDPIAKIIARMQRPTTSLAARSGLDYGYGLGLYQFQRNGVSFFGHGGDADGYLAYLAYSPDLDCGYFVVINAFNQRAIRQIRSRLEDTLSAKSKPKYPAVTVLSEAQRMALTGEYEPVTSRFPHSQNNAKKKRLVISEKNERLYSQISGGKEKLLVAVTTNHFRRPWQTVATIAFIEDGGRLVVQGDFGNFVKSP